MTHRTHHSDPASDPGVDALSGPKKISTIYIYNIPVAQDMSRLEPLPLLLPSQDLKKIVV